MPEWIVALVTLSVMEIVLGIDNIIFIAIVADRLPPAQRNKARQIGLLVALGMRLLLLFGLTWLMGLTAPLFTLPDLSFLHMPQAALEVSGRDLILIVGGLFLIGKSVLEIHEKLEGPDHADASETPKVPTFGGVLAQIAVIDIIFSLDSVITAVGMVGTKQGTGGLPVMIAAMVIAVGVMLTFAGTVSRFVERHPTIKMLALSFLILIGVMLLAEGFGQHVDKGYVYFAMAFAVGVEMLNLRVRKKAEPVLLHGKHMPKE